MKSTPYSSSPSRAICSTSVWNRNEKLTLSERKYLETVISPFKDKVKFIKKQTAWGSWEKLVIVVNEHTAIEFPSFNTGEFFNGMITDIPYTLKDLGLEIKSAVAVIEKGNGKKFVEEQTGIEVLSIVTLDVIDGKVVIQKTIEDYLV